MIQDLEQVLRVLAGEQSCGLFQGLRGLMEKRGLGGHVGASAFSLSSNLKRISAWVEKMGEGAEPLWLEILCPTGLEKGEALDIPQKCETQ